MSVLLSDVLVIPEHWGTEDYVLRLTDSVGGAAVARTLDEYVEKYRARMIPGLSSDRRELRRQLTRHFWGEER